MNDALLLEVLNDLQKADRLNGVELNELIEQYPWFTAAHVLHAAHVSRTHGASATTAWQQASLYCNRPAVLEWQYLRTQNGNIVFSTDAAASESTAQLHNAATDAAALVESHDAVENWMQEDLEDATRDAQALVNAHDSKEVWNEEDLSDAAADADALVAAAEQSGQLEEVQPLICIGAASAETEKPTHVPLAFEPYHTIDYFASQGIRLQEDKLGTDDLSRQVKTFTQWLRTMKKLYHETQTELTPETEEAIHHIADTSNQETEVITETMAEVLALQGKKAKAIEIYGKLILLHPEKSAYFADRIKQLK